VIVVVTVLEIVEPLSTVSVEVMVETVVVTVLSTVNVDV
jgi:hypothetical protein